MHLCLRCFGLILILPQTCGYSADSPSTTTTTTKAVVVSDAVDEMPNLSPPKLFGFLDESGTGHDPKLVETTSIAVPSQDNSPNEEADNEHQISLKDSKWKTRRKRLSHLKASFLTMALVGLSLWSPALFQNNKDVILPFRILLALLYFIECLTCSTRKYLSNSLSPGDFSNYLNQLQLAPPQLVWTIECFHYRTIRQYDRRTGRSTTRQEKVVTHRASSAFHVERWSDVTSMEALQRIFAGGEDDLASPSSSSATFLKMTLSRFFVFTNPMIASRFYNEEAAFTSREGHYDVHSSLTRSLRFGNNVVNTPKEKDDDDDNNNNIAPPVLFQPKLLVVRTGLSNVAMASQLWFWMASLVGLTVPFRIWFARHCIPVELMLTKTMDG